MNYYQIIEHVKQENKSSYVNRDGLQEGGYFRDRSKGTVQSLLKF